MAAGFRSPLPWLGLAAAPAPAEGGYITLPWWQAGGLESAITDTTGGGPGTHARRLIEGMMDNRTRAEIEDEELISMLGHLFGSKKKPH